jgi:hypothetical protein
MKRTLMILAMGCMFLSMAGCATDTSARSNRWLLDGMVDDWDERRNRFGGILDNQSRQVVDDWDYFWLQDRSSRLTPWHVQVGGR